MSRQSGSLSLSSNLEPKMAAPLDAREKVANLTELVDPNSFPYSWIGMPVYVVSEEKWYCLRYADTTNIDNWVTIGTGKNGRDGRDVGIEGTSKQGRENTVTFVWYDPSGSDRYTDLTVLDGAVGPEGPRGPEGPAGADGQSFSITGIYESYEAMIEAHPTGNEGDAYFVQSDEEGNPPDVYVWLSEDNEWKNIGPLQGGRGIQGPVGPQGYSPEIAVAETTDSSYKLRVTNQSGSYLTPNLKGNLAPIDTIDPASAVPVQSKTIAAALDEKQDKVLATPVGVRDYATENIVNQTTVQTTLEALAAAINYMNIPVQLIQRVDTEQELPANAKPGSICFVGEEGDTPVVYIRQDDNTWQKAGGASDMSELTDSEVDQIWDEVVNRNNNPNNDPDNDPNNGDDNNDPNNTDPVVEDTWVEKTWNIDNIYVPYIWDDGENVYYSNGANQYVLNKSTSTWEPKTWNGMTTFVGQSVWKDDDNIYYSNGSDQYVLDKSTSTWNPQTWKGLTSFNGSTVWSSQGSVYCNDKDTHYVLNKQNSTWVSKSWGNYFPMGAGQDVWTDGENTYYSGGTHDSQYVLDPPYPSTSYSWHDKTWNGFRDLLGRNIWVDGDEIYYSKPAVGGNTSISLSDQYMFDKDTSKWVRKDWNILVDGSNVWTDGENIYCVSVGKHYVLRKPTS